MTTLCKNCVSGYVLPGEPKGTIKDGAYVYSSGSESESQDGGANMTGKTAIILLTDIFGLDLKNSKILADSFGDRLGPHCDVHVPDLFNGKYMPHRFRRTDKPSLLPGAEFLQDILPSVRKTLLPIPRMSLAGCRVSPGSNY